jgi:hypothetical protein
MSRENILALGRTSSSHKVACALSMRIIRSSAFYC